MGSIDTLIKLATENSLKGSLEIILRLKRLRVSFNTIAESFDETTTNRVEIQKKHMSAIEEILYQYPLLLPENLVDDYFSIKSKLDLNISKYPLAKASYEKKVKSYKSEIDKKIKFYNYTYKLSQICIFILILAIIIISVTFGILKLKTEYYKLSPLKKVEYFEKELKHSTIICDKINLTSHSSKI